jgi:phenylpropionate dioxygenase-like ring-hydroxylating dioxygenase large terminal subunit
VYPLADGLFAPRNQWYIAAWSSEVTRTVMERWILDEPVAFYRREDGAAVAVAGRCPHRSFPLGKSRVVGDNIQCGYHGVTFRPDGSCASIPSQPHIPNACRIRSYPIVELWKWLWIWTGDPSLSDEKLIPDHFAIGLTDPRFKAASDIYHYVNSRYMLLHDNLFDLTHIGYLHRDSFGEDAGADEIPAHASGHDWIESRFEQADIPRPPFFAAMLGYDGPVVRHFGLRLHMPCLHVGGDDIYAVGEGGGVGSPMGSFRVYHAVTPATRHSSHYFWAMAHDWDHDDPDHAINIATSLIPALQEDIDAVEYIEEMVRRSGGRPSELLLRADNVCVLGRRAFERLIRAELPIEEQPLVGA